VNISEQFNHGAKALLAMIVFLSALTKQLKECDPSTLHVFASFFLSRILVYIIPAPWFIGFRVSGTTQMRTLVYGWWNWIVMLMVHLMQLSYTSMQSCVLLI
jgi:hypothetical protein